MNKISDSSTPTNKPLLVFLPGMMCDQRSFAEVEAGLTVREVEYKSMHAVYRKNTIEDIAADVLAQIEEHRFYALGLSMGGIVLMEMLRQAPQRIALAIMADTNHKAELPERRALRTDEIAAVSTGGLVDFVVEEMKPKYLSPKLDSKRRNAINALLLEMATRLGEKEFIRQSIALRDRKDQSQTLKRIAGSTSVLFICGEDDKLCLPDRHREMHGLVSHSKLAFVEKAGHLSCMENPAMFCDLTVDFLQTLHPPHIPHIPHIHRGLQ